jgi:hypothetical protein
MTLKNSLNLCPRVCWIKTHEPTPTNTSKLYYIGESLENLVENADSWATPDLYIIAKE